MSAKQVKRNHYAGVTQHSPLSHAQDYENFHVPLARMHHAALHGSGVAQGLAVKPGATGVLVEEGIAVDAEGRLIALAKGTGSAVIWVDPTDLTNFTPADVPVLLDTSGFAGQAQKLYVTIEFYEKPLGGGTGGQLVQGPYLRLQPALDPASGQALDPINAIKNGIALVLAIVTTDEQGKVTALKAADPQLPYRRHLVGQSVEELQLRRAVVEGDTLSDAVAGTLAPDEAGGLQISPGLSVAGSLRLQSGEAVCAFSNDAELSVNGALAVPTQLAVKTYVSTRLGQVQQSLATRAALEGSCAIDFHAKDLTVTGRLGTNGLNPQAGYPAGWGGGIHTWDLFAEGGIGVGRDGALKAHIDAKDGFAFFAGGLRLQSGAAVNEFSNDAGLSANSNLAVPTQQAVKAYVDNNLDQMRTVLSTKAALDGSPTQDFRIRRLAVTGQVGIGTAEPQQELEIVAAAENADLRLRGNNQANVYLDVFSGKDGGGLWHYGNVPLRFGTQGTERLTILSNGNVGIGTTDPRAPLHIASYMAVGPFSATTSTGRIDVTGPFAQFGFVRRSLTNWPANPAPGDRFAWYNPDGSARLWTEAKGDLLEISRDGNVGIKGSLVVGAGASGSIRVRHIDGKDYQSDKDDALYLNWSTGKAVVVGGPNVGAPLQVNGDLTVAGNVGIGTAAPENAEEWGRVLELRGPIGNARLSVRSNAIDGRVMVHEEGWYGAPAGMIVGTNTLHALSLATAGKTRLTIDTSGNIVIGSWRIFVDGRGLIFTNGIKEFILDNAGEILCDRSRVIKHGDPIYVTHNTNGFLNGTVNGDGSHGSEHTKWAYWRRNPDGDADLYIRRR